MSTDGPPGHALSTDRLAMLRWQFELTWSLAEVHLAELTDADMLWPPASHCWTVHRDRTDGLWRPDWQVPEPEPIPVPTAAWVCWHIQWWWGTTVDHLRGRVPRDRTEVFWPGDATSSVEHLRALRADWLDVLDGLAGTGTDTDLDAPATYPWAPDPEAVRLTVAHTVAWVNAELMKNVTEIGQLRMLRIAGATR